MTVYIRSRIHHTYTLFTCFRSLTSRGEVVKLLGKQSTDTGEEQTLILIMPTSPVGFMHDTAELSTFVHTLDLTLKNTNENHQSYDATIRHKMICPVEVFSPCTAKLLHKHFDEDDLAILRESALMYKTVTKPFIAQCMDQEHFGRNTGSGIHATVNVQHAPLDRRDVKSHQCSLTPLPRHLPRRATALNPRSSGW